MASQGTGDSDYVDIPAMVEGYKPPCPPKWKKRDVFDEQKVRELDEKAKQVTITSSMTFEDLAFELTHGLKNDLHRVRSLFVWLGGEDVEGQVYPKVTDARTPLGFMKLMKNKKGTYAEFFAQLCRAANLPCVMLEGNGKGVGYEVGEQDVSKMRVTWNAVFVDGSWQIVHPMWAFTAVSGHDTGTWTKIEVEGKGTRVKAKASKGVNIRHIDEFYFLPDPDEFIYECIAEKQDWQLLKQPWDLHKYCNVPHFQLEYFTSDYKLTSQHQAILVSIDGKCELEFLQKEGATSNLTYELFFDEVNSDEKLPADVELPRTVFFETNGNNLRLLVRFHVVGIYKLSISAGYKLAEFRLEAKEKSYNENVFPVNPPIGFGFGQTAMRWGLISPSHTSGVVVTQRNTVETFNFTMTRITQILARLRHVRIDSDTLSNYVDKTIIGNNVSIKVTMPDDSKDEEYALQVYTEYERQENNVLNYLLTNRKEDFEKESEKQKVRKTMQEKQKVRNNMQEKRIRRHLATALILKTVGPLERSVKEFEEADLKDIDGQFRRGKTMLGNLKEEKHTNAGKKHLMNKLKTAMRDRDIEDLENAISKAEQAGYKDLEELVLSAKEMVLELEQLEIDEAKAFDLRCQLQKATDEENMKELEEAIAEFQDADVPDKGDLRRAKQVLCQLYEAELEEAMSQDDLVGLQRLLRDREKSVIAKELKTSQLMKRAERFHQQQRRMKGCLSNPLELNNSTVAEIKGYKKPKAVTQDIMRASFILLGKPPKQVESWKSIQKYLQSSKDVLKKIKTVKKTSLHNHTIKRASQLLGKYTTDDVREVSAGVAAFYRWSNNMIQDRSTMNSDND